MRLISERHAPAMRRERWKRYAGAAVAVGAAAAVGSMAADADSAWYRSLRKPVWQPPPSTFGIVWTSLYASLAYAAGHALGRTQGLERTKTAASFGVNLALNAGWTWLFFGFRSPRAALAGTLLLDISYAELIRRAFATALNTSLAHRNP
ncbi:TspO/MBR family protein [Streptomyces erythrochromogenes]|uniref:TspO/MBR family protein n=1 Tax=Streptomyces erythrochromogenes TaxID=285574 RepID=UPI00369AF083